MYSFMFINRLQYVFQGRNPILLLGWFSNRTGMSLPWVPEVFLACGWNFRCWPKADTSSAVGRSHERRSREKNFFSWEKLFARVTIKTWQKPETALEKSLAPRVECHLTTGKRAERTKLDFRCPICRTAIGQASYLTWASRRQPTFPFCW